MQDRFYLGREVETFRSEDTKLGHEATVALAERQCERLNAWDEAGQVGPPPTLAQALREVREHRVSYSPFDRSAAATAARSELRAAAQVAWERGATIAAVADAAGVSCVGHWKARRARAARGSAL